MKVLSKEQFDAIQYTSIEAIRDFLDGLCPGTEMVEGDGFLFIGSFARGNEIRPGQWLVDDGYDLQVLSDEVFKERYISADAFNDAVKYANGVNSLVFELDEKVDELRNKIEGMSFKEKEFIALAHMTSHSDDIHARDNTRIARIKKQILDKL